MKHLYIILLTLMLTSCLGTKRVVQKELNKSISEKIEVKKDSTNIIEKNKAIKDIVQLLVPKTKSNDSDFNKQVDKKVDETLSKLNTRKTSGDNSYKLHYNLLKRQLEFEAKVGETKNEKIATNTAKEKDTQKEETSKASIYKRITTMPWYLWIVIYFILLDSKVTLLLSNFIPKLKGARSILSLLKIK